jgi:NAD+--asparagine ADP-ribosyltransferase
MALAYTFKKYISKIMHTVAEFEIKSKDINLINNVKQQVDEVYERQQIFGLSLETLELTRRFNNIITASSHIKELEPWDLHQLMVITRHLERNLIQEVK